MSATQLVRQPFATAIAGALPSLGATGTVWATSSADPPHPTPPAQTSPPNR